ncbi:hypothetical protein ABZY90_34395, partial [Streptomyces sp. NPDC006422]|uniref:hypothetical protein n=1 Tax=Streptomyces sp. NPDC006422 TaxID=3155457 RepID=UPI00339FA576
MLRSGQQGCDLGAFDDLTDVGDEIPMPRVRRIVVGHAAQQDQLEVERGEGLSGSSWHAPHG